jgi:uncharacterized protein with ParB-like and HNH nuclease domain
MNEINILKSAISQTSQTFNLKDLFENNFFFIPDYQRGYSWESDQLVDLTNDIENISKLDHNHYTGTIVAAKDPFKENTYELVDGQQRLTTLLILLNQIYFLLPEKYEEIKSLYISRGTLGAEKLVFTPNLETQDCFEQAILYNQPFNSEIKSHECMIGAKNYFLKWLTLNQDSVAVFYHTITTKLSFLFYTPHKEKDIGIMFEVINNRGKKLSELEKIKNYFIYYSTVHDKITLREEINKRWVNIQENLSQAGRTSNNDENVFLRNCYLVFFKSSKDKSWEVYNECKAEFNVNILEDGHVNNCIIKMRDFVSFLASASRHYAWFYNQKYFISTYNNNFKNELNKCLTYLRCQYVNASIMPLYLAIMNRLDQPERVVNLLSLIEKVNMRLYILPGILSRADSKQGDLFYFANEFYKDKNWTSEQEILTTTYNQVLINGDIFNWLEDELIQITYAHCDLEKFVNSLILEEADNFDFYSWTGIRYFLACYEEQIMSKRAKRTFDIQRILSGKKIVGDNFNDQLSLEHIWAAKNRQEDFPPGFFTKRRLGNFVLCGLSSNISLSNYDIPDKISELANCNSVGEGALDMLQVAELKALLDNSIKEVEIYHKKKTKNYWRDVADNICNDRERILIDFATERWKLTGEKRLK